MVSRFLARAGEGLAEQPLVVPQERYDVAVGGDGVDLYLGPADHEVGVDRRAVEPALGVTRN